MKKNIHPDSYQPVVFHDVNNDFKVLTRSTIDVHKNSKTIEWEDGNTYPLVQVHISAASHTFYTGKKVAIDELGSISKFNAKYAKKKTK